MNNKKRELKCKKISNILTWVVISASVIGIATALTMLFYGKNFPVNPLTMICFLVVWFGLISEINRWARSYTFEYNKLRKGSLGEELTRDALMDLPEGYTYIPNIELEIDGQKCEIDTLVISPRGICVVETKNFAGVVTGLAKDKDWLYDRYLDSDSYRYTFKNPIKQSKRQATMLGQYLKAHGHPIYVDNVVHIHGPEVRVDSDKVYTTNEGLQAYLINSGSTNRLSQAQIEEITHLLHNVKPLNTQQNQQK